MMALRELMHTATPLRRGEDPFEELLPGDWRIPLVLGDSHSGNRFPPSMRRPVDDDLLRRFIEPGDTGVDAIVRRLMAMIGEPRFPYIRCNVLRTTVDVNCRPDDIDRRQLIGDWPLEANPWGTGAVNGRGVFTVINDRDRDRLYPEPEGEDWRELNVIGARSITVADALARLEQVYYPYNNRLDALLDTAYKRFGTVHYLVLHSTDRFAPHGTSGPDVCISDGSLEETVGRTAPAEVTELVAEVFRSRGFDTRVNDPYLGGTGLSMHSDFRAGRHALQVEFAKGDGGILVDERTLVHNGPVMVRAAQAVKEVIERLSAYYA